ncbi:DsbA family protein [Aestuariivirga sp.]|jgi:protein-disulfide isomerase|uniref:DsbA family protein n=1 Tax=Aestuariivirga sp. TaxID=2650926 RepID=UPI0035AFF288
MNRRILVIATGAVAFSAFGAGAYWFGGLDRSLPPTAPPREGDALVRAHSPIIGPAAAPVTIIEFFDPACEACRAFYPVVKQIMDMFPGKVRLVLRYTPLHQGSDEAVRILETARLQGQFIPVLEALLARQPEWADHGSPNLRRAWEIARAAGLDVDRARRDMNTTAITTVLETDIADMRANGINRTPTFFVNGKPLPTFGAQQLFELVRSEVGRIPAS